MELFRELFSDWMGILVFLVIAFMIAMGAFLFTLFIKKSKDPNG